METSHKPVMVTEVVDIIGLRESGTFADLTFGEGGHSELFLKHPIKELFALDRDPRVIQSFQSSHLKADSRLSLTQGKMSQFSQLFKGIMFDGILADLGVSTQQILSVERGFSFRGPGPLDMRMDSESGMTLKDFLERMEEKDLATAIETNTGSGNALPVSRRILKDFRDGRVKTTQDLTRILGGKTAKRHPATVVFLALRMLVNDELAEIRSLEKVIEHLKPGGRLVVITFHSTEDREVKLLFKKLAGYCVCGLMQELCVCPRVKKVELVMKKPLVPSRAEVRENPRARSAKLRGVGKVS